MTTPTALHLAAVLDRYRAGLRDVTDIDLEHRAETVAALPGRLAAVLRHLVDAEREYRQAVRRRTSLPAAPTVLDRSRVVGTAAGAVSAGAGGAIFAGRALAEHVDQVPHYLLYSPAVAAVLVAVVVGGCRLARWFDDRRYFLATDIDEADLDPLGWELLAQVRARRSYSRPTEAPSE